MMQENYHEYEISFSEAFQIYVHRNSKDPNQEYSCFRKQIKGNEVLVYKDLNDRNPLLTIYRAVSYDQSEKQNNINQIISWLQNQQKIILQKSNQSKLNEKSFLKHILTQINTKFIDQNNSDLIKQNQTLVHYVNEAIEKQGDGYVNNILMMVQPIKNKDEMEYINYFAQAVSNQMKQSKKPQILTESYLRCNKTIFINLTGKESLKNLELWQQSLEKSDEFIYFSFIKIKGNQESDYQKQFDQYSNYFKNMEQANFNYYLLPYYSPEKQDNILHGQLVKIFFQNFMHNRIEKFSHKAYIALSLSLSDDIEYDPFAIQFLINNLKKLSNDRLMIHIDVEIKEDDIQYIQRLTQLMNLCYSSFQEQNITIQQLIPQDKLELCQLINRLKNIYCYLNLDNQYKQIQYCKIAIKNLKQEVNKMKNTPTKFDKLMDQYSIFYKKSSQQYQIIRPELENNDIITPYTQIIINYQDDIILIYQDGDKKFLYFLQINNEHLKKQNLIEKIKFTNLTSYLGSNNIKNQIVFYCNFQIFILYGQEQNTFIMEGLKYNILNKESTNLQIKNQDKLNQGIFHSKIAISKFTKEQLIEKLKSRVSPTVCIEYYTDQILKVILFGGENIDTPQIMNLVEYMEIKDSQFITGILDKSNLFKDLSFKPCPGQTILNMKFQNDTMYLILPGNDILRRKGLNHPINSQFSQNAVLMKKGCLDFQNYNIPIKYYGDVTYGLSYISNSQQNFQLIFQDDILAIWRVIYTQTMKIESIQKLKVDFSQSWGNRIQNTECKNKKEKIFKEQHHEMDMILSYFIEIQKELNENDIIELVERKKIFDNSKQASRLNIQDNQQDMQIEILKQKLDKGQLCDLQGKPFFQKDKMQEEKGNLNEQQQNNYTEYFKQNVLDIYDGDTNQFYQIAYENYLYLDIQSKQLSVKQFTYLIGDAFSLPQIDINSSQSQNESNKEINVENSLKNK